MWLRTGAFHQMNAFCSNCFLLTYFEFDYVQPNHLKPTRLLPRSIFHILCSLPKRNTSCEQTKSPEEVRPPSSFYPCLAFCQFSHCRLRITQLSMESLSSRTWMGSRVPFCSCLQKSKKATSGVSLIKTFHRASSEGGCCLVPGLSCTYSKLHMPIVPEGMAGQLCPHVFLLSEGPCFWDNRKTN